VKLLKRGDSETRTKKTQHTWDNGNPRVRSYLSESMLMVSNSLKSAGCLTEVTSEDLGADAAQYGIVPVEVNLPFEFQVTTAKLLDAILALSPQLQKLSLNDKKIARKSLYGKLYAQTRPGYYRQLSESLHLAYLGQPDGHGKQHLWRLFCDESIKAHLEILIYGSALAAPIDPISSDNEKGRYSKEWGGLYLRSEAELRVAEALDKTGILFFANARGRVGLQETIISNGQLTGRVEADFLVFYQGKCIVLEVDGVHHSEGSQVVRDYARDRVLLRSGVPTVRFTAKDCMNRPDEVVAEAMAILRGC
jgi:Protein of unknown function (DUF559)